MCELTEAGLLIAVLALIHSWTGFSYYSYLPPSALFLLAIPVVLIFAMIATSSTVEGWAAHRQQLALDAQIGREAT